MHSTVDIDETQQTNKNKRIVVKNLLGIFEIKQRKNFQVMLTRLAISY